MTALALRTTAPAWPLSGPEGSTTAAIRCPALQSLLEDLARRMVNEPARQRPARRRDRLILAAMVAILTGAILAGIADDMRPRRPTTPPPVAARTSRRGRDGE